jgi:hypothetical protein
VGSGGGSGVGSGGGSAKQATAPHAARRSEKTGGEVMPRDLFDEGLLQLVETVAEKDGMPDPDGKKYCIDIVVNGERWPGFWKYGTDQDIARAVARRREAFEKYDLHVVVEE